MLSQKRKVCGRGVLALKSWKPMRKPGETGNQNSRDDSKSSSNSTEGQKVPESSSLGESPEQMLLVKYNYQANPDQPGGFQELSVKQGQTVTFLKAHTEQSLWWLVKDQSGDSGYAPASYMMVLDERPSSLPWLENNKLDEKKEQSQANTGTFANAPVNTWKPYVSAYGGAQSAAGDPNQERKYYCGVCEKQLNGPKPYQAHMVSKAHKEEVEVQGL